MSNKTIEFEASAQFEGDTIKINAEYLGNKKWSCDGDNYNNHTITVEYNGNSEEFEAWASLNDTYFRTENDLIGILAIICNEACSSENDFEDFCKEFGYEANDYDQYCDCYDDECDCEIDYTNQKAKSIYEACEESREKLESLGLDCSDLYNSLNENYPDAM